MRTVSAQVSLRGLQTAHADLSRYFSQMHLSPFSTWLDCVIQADVSIKKETFRNPSPGCNQFGGQCPTFRDIETLCRSQTGKEALALFHTNINITYASDKTFAKKKKNIAGKGKSNQYFLTHPQYLLSFSNKSPK